MPLPTVLRSTGIEPLSVLGFAGSTRFGGLGWKPQRVRIGHPHRVSTTPSTDPRIAMGRRKPIRQSHGGHGKSNDFRRCPGGNTQPTSNNVPRAAGT